MQTKDKGIVNVMDTVSTEFEPLQYAVYPLIPEGLTLLVGNPKTGKSWVGLQLCIAVSTGGTVLGKLPVDQGRALYLALEDNERRMKRRLETLGALELDMSLFDAAYDWPTVDEGGKEQLEEYLTDNPDTRLVVVDTLIRFKDQTDKGRQNVYDVDYKAVKPLFDVARKYNVPILAVHHTNKQDNTEDWFKNISGSFGLTGGVDNAILLDRSRGNKEALLKYDGRDVEDSGEIAIQWDHLIGGWKIVAETSAFYELTPERKLIYTSVQTIGTASPKEITVSTGLPEDTVNHALPKMVKTGHLIKPVYGKYQIAGSTQTVQSLEKSA